MKFAKYFVLVLFLSSNAHAYLSIAESAEVLPVGKYSLGVEPQFLTNKGGGTNLNVFLNGSLNESTSARVTIGAGAIDFNAFASVKWVPFPDVDNQPAMGIRAGAGLARDGDENLLQLQVAPLISKKYETEYGLTVPYVAVPVAFLNTKEENYVASNIAFGSEYTHPEVIGTFGAEVGLDLNKSYSYISIFATFPFDSATGFGN